MNYQRPILVAGLLFCFISGVCQTMLEEAPLKIHTQQDKLTKTVRIQYLNQSNKPLLLWTGDWVINYYEPDSYRYPSYKTPFANILYIQQRGTNSQESFDYVYGNNVAEYTNFDNYRLLDVGESLTVKFDLAGQVFQAIQRKPHEALVVYAVIDILNLTSERVKTTAASEIQQLQGKELFDPLISFRKKGGKDFYFNSVEWTLPQKIVKSTKAGAKTNTDSPITLKPLAALHLIKQYAHQQNDSLSCALIHAFSRQYSVRIPLN